MKKWIVIGGTILSRTDGDKHYVSAHRLCGLYNVNPAECYLVEEHGPQGGLPDLPILRPRYDGDYENKA